MKFKVYGFLMVSFSFLNIQASDQVYQPVETEASKELELRESSKKQGFSFVTEEIDLPDAKISFLNQYRKVYALCCASNQKLETKLDASLKLLTTPSTDMQVNKQRVLQAILCVKKPLSHLSVSSSNHTVTREWREYDNIKFRAYLDIQRVLDPHPIWRPRTIDEDVKDIYDFWYTLFPYDYVCGPTVPTEAGIFRCVNFMEKAVKERLKGVRGIQQSQKESALHKKVLRDDNTLVIYLPKHVTQNDEASELRPALETSDREIDNISECTNYSGGSL